MADDSEVPPPSSVFRPAARERRTMPTQFLTEDFLLQTKTARTLYHEHAEHMPIYDYHCHLPAQQSRRTTGSRTSRRPGWPGTTTWRAMRANGIDERYVTGDAGDGEKFEKWAATVPFASATRCTTGPTWSLSGTSASRASCSTAHRQGHLPGLQRKAAFARVQRPQPHAKDERQARLHDRRPARHARTPPEDPPGRFRDQGPHCVRPTRRWP